MSSTEILRAIQTHRIGLNWIAENETWEAECYWESGSMTWRAAKYGRTVKQAVELLVATVVAMTEQIETRPAPRWMM